MKLLCLIAVIFFPGFVAAQAPYLLVNATYSTYSMSQLKHFQADYINQSPVKGVAVTTFPAYGGWGASVALLGNEAGTAFGVSYTYNTTGGRVDYQDYSGVMRLDQLLTANSFGLFADVKLGGAGKWRYSAILMANYVMTTMKMAETISVGSSSNTDNYNLASTNYGFRPSFSVTHIFSPFFLQAAVGYEMQIEGNLHLKGNKDAYLADSNDNPVKVQWMGLRTSIGVGIFLKKRKQE